MSLLVCGGAGYIGTQLVLTLLKCNSTEIFEDENLNQVRDFIRKNFSMIVVVDSLINCQNSSTHIQEIIAAFNENNRAKRDAMKVELMIGDLADPSFVESCFAHYKNVEGIIDLAAHSCVGESTHNSIKYYDNNINVLLTLLRSMEKFGTKNLVFSSTAAVYGDVLAGSEKDATEMLDWKQLLIKETTPLIPQNPYGRSKLSCEWIIKDQALSFNNSQSSANHPQINGLCLRYFNACGCSENYGESHQPETHLIPILLRTYQAKKVNYFLENVLQSGKANIKQYLMDHNTMLLTERIQAFPRARETFTVFGQDYSTNDGTAIRDYIHVHDLSIAHLQALAHLFKRNQEEQQPKSHYEAFNLGSGTGYSVSEIVKEAQSVIEEDYGKNKNNENKYFDSTIEVIYGDRREGDPPILVADASRAGEVLGWSLHTPKAYRDAAQSESKTGQIGYLKYILSTAWEFHKKHPFNYDKELNELFFMFYE